MKSIDVIIIGAGAAGLMAAIEAGKRQRNVIVLDHANKPGKKILMSGGGRCNFTNYNVAPEKFISHNPHFCKSALSRYTSADFIKLIEQHNIAYHEKTLGQLFCDHSAKDIVNMLLAECAAVNAVIKLNTTIENIAHHGNYFEVKTDNGDYRCESVVIATGGLSIPTMGASPFAYKIAEQFGINVWPTRAGLVPLTLHEADKNRLSVLSGTAVDVVVSCGDTSFSEAMLFTHRGLSGPAILQISSYWQPGELIEINFVPKINLSEELITLQTQHPKSTLKSALSNFLPKKIIPLLLADTELDLPLQQYKHAQLAAVAKQLQQWRILPNGTEGYRTAEVTLGGIDCAAISSKTMEANNIKGLYFVGEALDVTGWLGGYNFQWAWASGWAAGQVC